jgi:3-deoxy-D-manno-octulosonic-acid transferase
VLSILLDVIYALALLLATPWLIYRRRKRGPSGVPLREYFGRVPNRPVAAHCVWLHGVSLGEINATRTLVAELHRRAPGVVVVISSTTQTGLRRAAELYPNLIVFRFPLDFSFAIRQTLTRVRPSIIVLLELEVWPNLLEVASAAKIPVVIANGRVTEEKSLRRFNWPVVRRLARRMFGRIRWVGAQDETYRARFIELGVPADRIAVTGSVKYDAADVSDHIAGQEELAQAMGIDADKPLWVCGSTGPEEETAVLDAYARVLEHGPELQLAIIPRKPERFDEVARLIVQRGYACLRRSTNAPVVPVGVSEPRPVFLGDTLGELRKFYSLATVVFAGRSLVPLGGSDVMEVAGLAKPVLVGPYTENFADAVSLLLSEAACRRVSCADALAAAVLDLLRHPARRERMGQAGRAAIMSRRGASARTVDEILALFA